MTFSLKSLRSYVIYLVYIFLIISIGSHFFANYIFNQNRFPDLHNKLEKNPVYSLLSPDTFSQSGEKILFVGDSYTQGAGDAYRDGVYDYSIAHLLARDKHVSVYNAGLSGHGNLAAARNAMWLDKLFRLPLLNRGFPSFDRIVFFFYEGNDLNNNLEEYEIFDHPEGVKEIISMSDPSFDDIVQFGYLSGLFIVDKSIQRFINPERDEASPDIIEGNTINPDSGYTNKLHAGDSIWFAPPLQAAAVELYDNEVDSALQMFFNSILALREYFEVEHLDIVYIPSPATIYSRPEIIEIQSYEKRKSHISSRKNSSRSKLIRSRIRDFTNQLQINFIDPTDRIIAEAREKFVHGPIDEKHLNKFGYGILYKFWMEQSDIH